MNVKSSKFVKASEDAQNNSKEECKEQPIEEKKENHISSSDEEY